MAIGLSEGFIVVTPKLYPFCDYSLKLLAEYHPVLAKNVSWSYYILSESSAGPDNRRRHILTQEESVKLTCQGFSKKTFEKFNYLIGEQIIYPINAIRTSDNEYELTMIHINNKSVVVNALGLDKIEDLFTQCPFLIELLRAGVAYSENNPYASLYDDSVLRAVSESNLQNEIENNGNKEYAYLREHVMSVGYLYEVVSKALYNSGLPNLHFFVSLACSNYEGIENRGFMNFYDKSFKSLHGISFIERDPLSEGNLKYIRKILEMTDEKNALILKKKRTCTIDRAADWELVGLGKTRSQALVKVEFLGLNRWRLVRGHEVVVYDGNDFKISNICALSIKSDEEKEKEERIKRFFLKIEKGEELFSNFVSVYESLKSQHHGTMIVVSEDAEKEADRLSKAKRAIKIVPVNLSAIGKKRLLKLSSIDGAILVDPQCNCYALGVILDGYIDNLFEGDSGRGARYNSAKLYIHSIRRRNREGIANGYSGVLPRNSMAIVISEDSYQDVFSSVDG